MGGFAERCRLTHEARQECVADYEVEHKESNRCRPEAVDARCVQIAAGDRARVLGASRPDREGETVDDRHADRAVHAVGERDAEVGE